MYICIYVRVDCITRNPIWRTTLEVSDAESLEPRLLSPITVQALGPHGSGDFDAALAADNGPLRVQVPKCEVCGPTSHYGYII